jgi:hypothetical protein
MMLQRLSSQRTAPARRLRAALTWLARVALTVTPVALSPASDSPPSSGVSICEAAGVSVETIEGSRLLQADRERLALMRGRALDCQHPRSRRVLAAIADAVAAWHLEGSPGPVSRQRLSRAVRVHVDPRLPARQAPIAGIEVHVTSGEVLVTSEALATLGAEVWQHELLHVLAARPPDVSPVARRLWLTLEEGVIEYLALSRSGDADGDRSAALSMPAAPPALRLGVAPLPTPPLPALALLASPAYDPHRLAGALARELERVESRPALERWLCCLAAVPSTAGDSLRESLETPGGDGGTAPGSEALAQVLQLFTSRCSLDTASLLSAALDRWWDMPRPKREAGGELRSEFSALGAPLR